MGLDSAINNVNAASVLLSIVCFPSLYKIAQKFKKYINNVAAILLFPSVNTWFLTIKYRKFAPFSSNESK